MGHILMLVIKRIVEQDKCSIYPFFIHFNWLQDLITGSAHHENGLFLLHHNIFVRGIPSYK